MDDPASIERAMNGIYRVYSVQDFWTAGARREVQQGSFRCRWFRVVLGKELYQMFRWLNQGGVRADIKELRRCYPEVHFQTLEEWLRNEGWHKRVRRVRPPRQENVRS